MPTGWLIFLGLVNLYILFLFWLVRTGRMERWNLSLMLGFVLMIRTQRGKGTLGFLARPRRLWSLFGDFGIVLSLVGMAAMTLFMLALVPFVLDPGADIQPLAANEILVIPGVNPFVPLWYGIIALIVTLVVHEGGHGVLALAHKMRVKSIGLLYAIVPIGAFVEPDEDDLMASSRRKRLQVYSAGPTVNIVLAVVLLLAFGGAMAAVTPVTGTGVATITQDQPAAMAGLVPGDIILTGLPEGADETVSLHNWTAFQDFMSKRHPGENVTFGLADGSTATVRLTSRWEVFSQEDQENIVQENASLAEDLQQDAFLGIGPYRGELQQEALANPFGDLNNFLFVIALPIGEVRGAPHLSFYMPTFLEAPIDPDLFWPGVNLLFWIFWINLMVGLTNILPMLPLDGGHIFRDSVGGVMAKLRPKMDEQARDRIVGRAAAVLSLVILGAFLLQIFGPRLAGAFA